MNKPIIPRFGGKYFLLKELLPRVPDSFNHYWEPFCGGASLFLNLRPRHATIGDADPDLINFYQCIGEDADWLMGQVSHVMYLKNTHPMSWFYDFLKDYNPKDRFKRAAKTYYLLNFSFNKIGKSVLKDDGYWAVKKNDRSILNYGYLFRRATIVCQSYEGITPSDGDFVYLDPPYFGTDNAYSVGSDWGEREQFELRNFCDILNKRGVKFMLSNSWNDFIIDLYREYSVISVKKRQSHMGGKSVKMANEALIRNYD